MDHLFADLTVVDAASYLAGPGAATIMADFGANVIKIEPPEGDGYRNLVAGHPIPYHWLLTSRNKKSLAVDLSKDAGQAVLHKLIAKADVFTTNFLAGQLTKFQLEYERLKNINPRLIFAHISGYGTQGPETERRAFDVTAWWARSGMMEFIRDPGQTPLAAAPGMGDHSTATAFYGAIMTGLYRREKTGEGCFVSTSLSATGVWANGMALQGVVAGNDLGVYRQTKGWVNPFAAAFASSEGKYIVFAMINTTREYPRLVEALNTEHWLDDERFSNPQAVIKNRHAFMEEMVGAVSQFDFKELCNRLDQFGITYGPVQTMAEVLEDKQLRANGIVIETQDAGEGYGLTIGSPINIREETKLNPSRAPDVGADSMSVLREMDFDEAAIAELISSGTVVTQATSK